jgi:two-component system invasion response regulator UvrY
VKTARNGRPADSRTQRAGVLVVDDSGEIAGLYQRLINSEPDLVCVGTLHSADRLPEAVERLGPDVVLLDLTMPGTPPLVQLREVARRRPGARVLLFSASDDPATVEEGFDAGAWGLVSKYAAPEAVMHALRSVAAGEVVFPSGDDPE